MLLEKIPIRRIYAKMTVETGFVHRRPYGIALLVQSKPFGMPLRRKMVPLHGNVDRNTDIALMTGFNLFF